ncbi:DNA ligase [compost metagenome]
MSKAIKTKMDKLVYAIEFYNHKEFVENKPVISDPVFDQLVSQLRYLEEKYPEYANKQSPTQYVGERSDINTFEQVKHKRQMLSLSKRMSLDELKAFIYKLIADGIRDFIFEPKIDGLALSLYYKAGSLIRAVTRGDGEIGDDVTKTAFCIKDIPKELPFKFDGEIRGEVYLKKSVLEAFNQARKILGLKQYKNVRNTASGLMKRKEVTEENFLLSFFAYGMFDDNREFFSYEESIMYVKDMGFPTSLFTRSNVNESIIPYAISLNDLESNEIDITIEKIVKSWTDIREDLDYEIDGIVVKVNDKEEQERLGMDTYSPKWATAYKFPASEKVTTLLGVEWKMGNKGNITPCAIIEMVEIGGTDVVGPTLHNVDEINRLDIRIGDQIVVSRRGDVIPKVEKALKELRTGDEIKIEVPTHCPTCNAPTKLNGAFLECSAGYDCTYMEYARIQNFVHSVEIDELGQSLIEKMIEAKVIADPADLYDAKAEQLEVLERMGKRSAEKVIANIQTSRDVQLHKVIAGLTIDGVGSSTAKDLANTFQSLEAFLYATKEQLQEIEGIGPVVSENIVEWCKNSNNINLIHKLIDREVGKFEELKTSSNKLSGKTFATSGKISIGRTELEKIILDNGGQFSSIKKGITHFIAGEKCVQSKMDKATSFGAEIINGEEFQKMLE